MEAIAQRSFAQVERAQAQDRAVSAAVSNHDAIFTAYANDPRSFGGRYVCADLFKERFDDYAASPVSRYLNNTPVHNTAAVLASEWLQRVIEDPREPRRDQVVFLTGIPGAGKTGFVNQSDELPYNLRAIYEGQLAKPQTALPKIARALDLGLAVTIAAVRAEPEFALRNTLTRFNEIGRGASINVMADIGSGLVSGLARIHAEFGDRVALRVYERNSTIEQQQHGWQQLSILAKDRDRERLYARLSNTLEAFREQGALSDAAYFQARGDEPRREHQHLAIERNGRVETPANRRSLSAVETPSADLNGAARAFLDAVTPRERRDACQQYPRLKNAFQQDAAAQAFAREHVADARTQATFVSRFRENVADALLNGRALPDVKQVDRGPER